MDDLKLLLKDWLFWVVLIVLIVGGLTLSEALAQVSCTTWCDAWGYCYTDCY